MKLRLDELLKDLRENTQAILEAIDRDPLLLRRTSRDLVLANQGRHLYFPQLPHQQYAKGIVYRRNPYRLVSLPLIKVYSLGEKNITPASVEELAAELQLQPRFLRKIDGSLIQVFQHCGKTRFTTRGTLEGNTCELEAGKGEDGPGDFDFVGEARRLAADRYPALLANADLLRNRTLLFELIHPAVPRIIQYPEQRDLILIACFDHTSYQYWSYPGVVELAEGHGLRVVEELAPGGSTLAEQVAGLCELPGFSNEEGSVLCLERGQEVVFRVKVKSPAFLLRMQQRMDCTYEQTVALADARPELTCWADMEAYLQSQGRKRVPEEVLPYYRQHYERYRSYLDLCHAIRRWAEEAYACVQARLSAGSQPPFSISRKAFAEWACRYPHFPLLFAALDNRLDQKCVRDYVPTPSAAQAALRTIEKFKPEW